MKCPRCGADVIVNEKMKFCTYCGLQITEEMLSGQNRDSTDSPENVNQGESSQEMSVQNQQGSQSFNSGQGLDQSNSIPFDNSTAPASNGIPGNNFAGSGTPNNNGLPPKQDNIFVSTWKKLSFFSKAFAIAITVSGILFIISVAMHKGFPILFSCILIFGLIVALFMHKQIFFKQPHNVYKYLIVFGAFALIVITIWSFTWNNSAKNNGTQATEPVVENSIIKVPASSDSYIGKMYTDVSSEMSGLGFITVRTEEVKDLEISDKSKDKTVISVTSDSKSFSAGDEMPKNSVITIKYHGLADIAVPISSEEAKSMDYEAVAELFKKAGFTNVSTTTLQDKDPDEMTGEFETTITVGTNTNVEKSLKVPVDTKIEICKHTAYEKFPVNLHFENNYPVGIKIKLDSKDVCAVEANTTNDIEYRAKQGSLNITIIIDESYTAEEKIEIDGPVNIGYVFFKDDTDYRYYESYEEHNRELKAGEIRLSFGLWDCEQNYNNVVEAFKQLGFKNVTASPVYDQNDSSQDNIVASVKIGDKSEFYRGEIYKDNNPVTITYHMAKTSDPNYVPPQPETKPEDKNSMPVMAGTNVNTAVNKAKEYGLSEPFPDDDYGHGTTHKALLDKSGGLSLTIIYSTKTKEILCARIVTTTLASDSTQKAFIKDMAGVLCPSADTQAVSDWVNNNVGGESTTTIGGFIYEVSLGLNQNAVYYAGESNWEEWESSQS